MFIFFNTLSWWFFTRLFWNISFWFWWNFFRFLIDDFWRNFNLIIYLLWIISFDRNRSFRFFFLHGSRRGHCFNFFILKYLFDNWRLFRLRLFNFLLDFRSRRLWNNFLFFLHNLWCRFWHNFDFFFLWNSSLVLSRLSFVSHPRRRSYRLIVIAINISNHNYISKRWGFE